MTALPDGDQTHRSSPWPGGSFHAELRPPTVQTCNSGPLLPALTKASEPPDGDQAGKPRIPADAEILPSSLPDLLSTTMPA